MGISGRGEAPASAKSRMERQSHIAFDLALDRRIVAPAVLWSSSPLKLKVGAISRRRTFVGEAHDSGDRPRNHEQRRWNLEGRRLRSDPQQPWRLAHPVSGWPG